MVAIRKLFATQHRDTMIVALFWVGLITGLAVAGYFVSETLVRAVIVVSITLGFMFTGFCVIQLIEWHRDQNELGDGHQKRKLADRELDEELEEAMDTTDKAKRE